MRMKKPVAALAALALAVSLCAAPVMAADTAGWTDGDAGTTPTLTLVTASDNSLYFFAGGTAITISAPDSPDMGAKISWDGGSLEVPANVNVFGGYHNNNTQTDTSITMTGGAVHNVIGGGLHASHVGTANIVMSGGTATSVQGGGASSLTKTCGCPNGTSWYAGNAADSPCRVDHANVLIDGGNVTSTLFGGGEGISSTGEAVVTVKSGSVNYLIAGGSNGYTGSGSASVSGGTVAVLQGVNRGSMETIDLAVSGGTVTNVYAGGETTDSSVTGTFTSAKVSVTGGAVTNLSAGTNGGQGAVEAAKDAAEITFTPGTVANTQDVPTIYHVKFLNEGAVVQETNSSDPAVTAPAAPTRDGYVFKGWKGADGALYEAGKALEVSGDATFDAVWTAQPAPTPTATPAPTATPVPTAAPSGGGSAPAKANPNTGVKL